MSMQFTLSERRQPNEAEVFSDIKRGFDAQSGMHVVKIISGDWYVTSAADEMLTTILGSCVSACIRDPDIGLGGMNHFLLPGDTNDASPGQGARYGAFAMENLINSILSRGGQKSRLEIKVFGGGNVTNNSSRIGSKNADFAREFLRLEGYQISAEDLGGEEPRRINYYPATGKVLMRKLKRREDLWIVQEEEKYSATLTTKPVEGGIDLF